MAVWFISFGRTGYHLVAIANTRDKKVEVYLCLTGTNAKKNFKRLEEDKAAIDKSFGPGLNWRALPEKKESQVRIAYSGDTTDRATWPELHGWLRQTFEKCHKTFAPRIKRL